VAGLVVVRLLFFSIYIVYVWIGGGALTLPAMMVIERSVMFQVTFTAASGCSNINWHDKRSDMCLFTIFKLAMHWVT
jgi:hypothetical protein